MSFSRIKVFVLIVIGALVGVGTAGEETRVSGRGYSSVGRPPVTDDPPYDYTTDGQGHDPESGQVYAGVNAYELYQGASPDDRQRHAGTDFVKWAVNGATLRAKGQATDSNPDKATRVLSDVWGMETVDVTVGADEGAFGTIRAENKIAFEYSFNVSGPAIGEASVRLSGTAFDIHGKPHSFSLSANAAEGVTTRVRTRAGLSIGASTSVRGHASAGTSGVNKGVDGEAKFDVDTNREGETEHTRRFGSASAANGIDGEAKRTDETSGQTPLAKRYSVFSDGNVALVVRTSGEGQEALVVLDSFIVKNELRCWKSASESPAEPPAPPPADPGIPAPTTPGSGNGAGSPGDGGDGGGGSGAPNDDDPDGEADGTGAPGEDADGHVGVDPTPWQLPFDGGCILVYPHPPHGLAGEPGALPGHVEVRLTGPAPRDLRVELAGEPASALAFPPDAAVVIEKGDRLGGLPFHANAAGATLVLTLLEEAGTALRMDVPLATASTSEWQEPKIWAALPEQSADPGRHRGAAGLVGEDVGPLRIGRLGFREFASEATTVLVSVAGQPDVLAPLPASLTIPAGHDVVELPFALGSAAGAAVVTLTHRDQVTRIHVRAFEQSWRGVPRVVIPTGAVAAVPFIVRHAQRTSRFVTPEVAHPLLAAVDPEQAIAELRAGERAWFVPLEGRAPGVTEVTLTTDGLPPLVVPVEIAPEWVRFVPGRLVISQLDGTRAGSIHLSAPADVFFADLELPATAADYLQVEGLGTAQLTLSFTPSADLPPSLSLPVQLVGPAPPYDVAVYDTHHGADYEGDGEPLVRNSYRVTVR